MPDLNEVNALITEFFQMAQAIHLFDIGGRIAQYVVNPPPFEPPDLPLVGPDVLEPLPPPPMPVIISAENMTYPPQMVEAIKTSIRSRQDEIITELAKLGLSGFEKIEAS